MGDPQELEWHERVRRTLDFQIENANFFVWIVVHDRVLRAALRPPCAG